MGVVKSIKYVGKEPVFNLTVKKFHNYFIQGGLLSKNCDSLRAFCIWWVRSPEIDYETIETKCHNSILEDIENATGEDREYLLKKYGEPA
jgi:hypothetical protein